MLRKLFRKWFPEPRTPEVGDRYKLDYELDNPFKKPHICTVTGVKDGFLEYTLPYSGPHSLRITAFLEMYILVDGED
jgi:hypothetical protein